MMGCWELGHLCGRKIWNTKHACTKAWVPWRMPERELLAGSPLLFSQRRDSKLEEVIARVRKPQRD